MNILQNFAYYICSHIIVTGPEHIIFLASCSRIQNHEYEYILNIIEYILSHAVISGSPVHSCGQARLQPSSIITSIEAIAAVIEDL